MRPALRVGGFAAVLVLVLAAGAGIGRLVGPLDVAPASHDGAAGHAGGSPEPSPAVAGLASAAEGYRLALGSDRAAPGRQSLELTLSGPDGAPVTAYDVRHEKRLHLVVVRRDLTGFQHVHPVLDATTGRWTVEVDLTPGAWRVIADFVPTGGEPQVLGTDLLVPGRFRPVPPGGQQLASSVDGYDVTLGGALAPGVPTRLTATVSRDGEPVRDLQPYLGAHGHLVALRAGDLGYLHVHPEDSGPGPAIGFHTELPTAGRYRLFLDFRHGGVVRTAAFTVEVQDSARSPEDHEDREDGTEGGSHDH